MTGVTDMPFRTLVRRYGSGLNVTEMIASQAAIRETRQSIRTGPISIGFRSGAVMEWVLKFRAAHSWSARARQGWLWPIGEWSAVPDRIDIHHPSPPGGGGAGGDGGGGYPNLLDRRPPPPSALSGCHLPLAGEDLGSGDPCSGRMMDVAVGEGELRSVLGYIRRR